VAVTPLPAPPVPRWFAHPSRAAALATVLTLLVPVGALADHPGSGGSTGGAGPIGVALMWGGAAFVLGMLIVAVLARLTRRAPRNDGDTP
jgi:hypothetical protein